MTRGPQTTPTARRWGAGTAAIVRLLIWSNEPMRGTAIARDVGVSQPRAVQVMAMLADLEAVESTAAGYVGDREALFELYWRRTRPRWNTERFWYSTQPIRDQAHRACSTAVKQRVGVGVSADVGPDLLAPWRRPTHVVVCSDADVELDDAGFVSAEGRSDASLILRHINDSRLLGPSRWWPQHVDGLPLVDPIQQWWDLLDLGGEDRAEAAGRLQSAILRQRIRP